MTLVKNYVAASKIHGLGIFAAEHIKAGTVVWRYVPGWDHDFTKDALDRLSPLTREYVQHFSFLSTKTGRYVLCVDNGRFMNHAEESNTVERDDGDCEELLTVAARDIEVGEEITSDYGAYDASRDW